MLHNKVKNMLHNTHHYIELVSCLMKPCKNSGKCSDKLNTAGHIVAECNCTIKTEGSYCQS